MEGTDIWKLKDQLVTDVCATGKSGSGPRRNYQNQIAEESFGVKKKKKKNDIPWSVTLPNAAMTNDHILSKMLLTIAKKI